MPLTLRLVKGSQLTFSELDGNFTHLLETKVANTVYFNVSNTGNVFANTIFGSFQGPLSGNVSATTLTANSLTLSTGATVTTVLDEDTMSSDSATALATQQSIKAYVDSATRFSILNSNTTLTAGALVASNSAVAVTFTLPATPTAGDSVTVSNQGAGTVTVGRNGENIKSLAEDGTLNAGTSTQLVYIDGTIGWGEL